MNELDKTLLKAIPQNWIAISRLPKSSGLKMRLGRLNHKNLIEIKFETLNSIITCLVRLNLSPPSADSLGGE